MEVLKLIKSRFAHSCLLWIKGLLAAFIGGGASAASAWMGIAMANTVGIYIPVLDWKALGIIFLSSGVSGALMYLKQSPVPCDNDRGDEDDDPKRSWFGAVMICLCFAGILLIFCSPAFALEKDYQIPWCAEHNGELEVVLDDGARVDCLTAIHAVEFDFAHKWAESIGQSLYYAIKTGKKPGVVLIMDTKTDKRYFARLKEVARRHGITVWIVEKKQ